MLKANGGKNVSIKYQSKQNKTKQTSKQQKPEQQEWWKQNSPLLKTDKE